MSLRLWLFDYRPLPAGSERRRQRKSRRTRLRARFYAIELRGAANAKVKHELGLRFQRGEWLRDTK
jgi:hypothetical protein